MESVVTLFFIVGVVNLIVFIWFACTLMAIKKASESTAKYLWYIARAHGAPVACVHGVTGQCAACNYATSNIEGNRSAAA